MIRLHINPKFSDLLHAHDLDRFASIMQTTAGEIIEENAERDTRRLQLGERVLYLKRVRTEKTGPAIESYARGHLAHSKPYREMLHFSQLREHGFDVAEVVAVGEMLCFGLPRQGFIITAEVSGQDLSEVHRAADKQQRRRILAQFGRLLGRLHDHGFYGSTRLKDIIYSTASDGKSRLVLIDREVRNPWPKRVNNERTRSRLLLNVRRQLQQGEIFRKREWREFSESYCASLSNGIDLQSESLFASIKSLRKRYKNR